jgi:hypothetical protein
MRVAIHKAQPLISHLAVRHSDLLSLGDQGLKRIGHFSLLSGKQACELANTITSGVR